MLSLNLNRKVVEMKVTAVVVANAALVGDLECAVTSVKKVNAQMVITVASNTVPMILASKTWKNLLPLKESPERERRSPGNLVVNVLSTVTTMLVNVVMNVVSNMVRMTLVSLLMKMMKKKMILMNVKAVAVVVVAQMVMVLMLLGNLVTLLKRPMKNVTTTNSPVVVLVMTVAVYTVAMLPQCQLKKLTRFATSFKAPSVASVIFAVVSTSPPTKLTRPVRPVMT